MDSKNRKEPTIIDEKILNKNIHIHQQLLFKFWLVQHRINLQN